MSTKLPLLLDECFSGPLAAKVRDHSSFWTRLEVLHDGHALGNDRIKDPQVVAYAKSEGFILVTVETRLNEHKYKVCTHPGIIVIATRCKHPNTQFDCFQKMMLSGHRKHCHHAVVKLHENDFEIIYLEGTTERRLTVPYNSKPPQLAKRVPPGPKALKRRRAKARPSKSQT